MGKENNFSDIYEAEEKLTEEIREKKKDELNKEIESKRTKQIKKKIIFLIEILIIFLLFSVMYNYYPLFKSATQKPTVLRYGTYNTDSKTDECIKNIWKLMANKKLKLTCPVSNKPYVIKGNIIYCSNPELHGFHKIHSENGNIPRLE